MRIRSLSSRLSPLETLVIAIPIVGLIGWLDFESGPVAMSLLYFVPISFAAWFSGIRVAVIVAMGAGVAWLGSEVAGSTFTTNVVLWNGFTRTSTFVILAAMVGLVRRDRDELHGLNERLQTALDLETKVARTDPLTGLPNTRSFRETLERELARSQREHSPIGIGYLDLDNFKKINDSRGHEAGDDVLRRVAEVLRGNLRAEDLAARLGGDEFAILSVRPTRQGLESIGERILADVVGIARDFEGTSFGCTIGFVLFKSAPTDTVAAIREADGLMYEVKSRSKGRCEVREARGEVN